MGVQNKLSKLHINIRKGAIWFAFFFERQNLVAMSQLIFIIILQNNY
jgi:hypothetical protein